MPMTMTEKILARAAGKRRVEPGENVWVNVDVLMTHDVCGPGTFGIFRQEFGPGARVWDRRKVVVIPDHYVFTADKNAQRNLETLRAFAAEQGLVHFYDVGTRDYAGVCHAALPERGHTRPGEVLLGTDSHTCTAGAFGEFATGVGNTEAAFVLGTGRLWLKVPATMRVIFEGQLPPYCMAKDMILHLIGDIGCDGAVYRALEFTGEAVGRLSMMERTVLTNMVIEAGGKNGVIEPDPVTLEYVDARNVSGRRYRIVRSDKTARYFSTHRYDVSRLEPTVAQPSAPDRRALARDLAEVKLDRAYLGSCTGGKTTDLAAAAGILQGRRVRIPTYVVPATTEVERSMDFQRIGGRTFREIFLEAGCLVGPPSCAACLGGPPDTFGRLNEPLVCISSTNRNFPGRMGHKESRVYLASPLTVAASAVTGRVTDPREFLA